MDLHRPKGGAMPEEEKTTEEENKEEITADVVVDTEEDDQSKSDDLVKSLKTESIKNKRNWRRSVRINYLMMRRNTLRSRDLKLINLKLIKR